jgi:hypothetical protein
MFKNISVREVNGDIIVESTEEITTTNTIVYTIENLRIKIDKLEQEKAVYQELLDTGLKFIEEKNKI